MRGSWCTILDFISCSQKPKSSAPAPQLSTDFAMPVSSGESGSASGSFETEEARSSTSLVGGIYAGWWFRTFVFLHILGIILPTDFHIFQRGWNHQPDMFIYLIYSIHIYSYIIDMYLFLVSSLLTICPYTFSPGIFFSSHMRKLHPRICGDQEQRGQDEGCHEVLYRSWRHGLSFPGIHIDLTNRVSKCSNPWMRILFQHLVSIPLSFF